MTFARPDLSQRASYKWWAFAAIAVGMFTMVVDHGAAGVALPTIANHFRVDLPTTQWVLLAYILTIAALLLPMGSVSDMIGAKRVYMAGFTVFTVGAFFAGWSDNVLQLILMKVVQGVGSAMTQGTSMAILLAAFPSGERGRALGLQMAAVGTGGIAGPVFGGLIVGALGWRWVFWSEALLGLSAVALASILISARRSASGARRHTSFDWPGAALSAGTLVLFLLGLTNGSRAGWSEELTTGALGGAALLAGSFVWWELRAKSPMLDLAYFRFGIFSLGVSASYLSFIGNSAMRFLMPFYLQVVAGYSPQQVGLIIAPSAAAMLVIGAVSGRLSDRFGWRKFTVGGLMLSVSGMTIMSRVDVSTPLFFAMLGMILQTSGTGFFNAPNNSSILSAVRQRNIGVMSGFLNLVRNAGNLTGIALATALVTAIMASHGVPPSLAAVTETGGDNIIRAFISGMHLAFAVSASVAAVALTLSAIRGGASEQRAAEAARAAADSETLGDG